MRICISRWKVRPLDERNGLRPANGRISFSISHLHPAKTRKIFVLFPSAPREFQPNVNETSQWKIIVMRKFCATKSRRWNEIAIKFLNYGQKRHCLLAYFCTIYWVNCAERHLVNRCCAYSIKSISSVSPKSRGEEFFLWEDKNEILPSKSFACVGNRNSDSKCSQIINVY